MTSRTDLDFGELGGPTTRERILAIAAAIACVSIVGIGLGLSIPLLSLEMERMGLSGTIIGLNTGVGGIASILVIPFVPRIAARIGVGRLLWIAIGLIAATLIAFKATMSIAWWFPLRFLFSVGLGVLFVLSEYWISAASPPRRRGLVMGIYATVLSLGFAAGPATLVLLGTVGWAPYLAGTALFATAAIPLLVARGLTPRLAGESRRSVLSFVFAAPAATAAAFVFGAVETGGFALLPVYGLRVGYNAEAAAFLVSLVAFGNVLFQIPMGLLSDKVDRRLLLLATALVGAAGAAAIPAATGTPHALEALLFVWGGIISALYTVGLAHLGARFSGPDLASANAAFVILYNVGLIMGPPVAGAGMDWIAPHGFAYALAGFFVFYLVVVAGRMARRRPA